MPWIVLTVPPADASSPGSVTPSDRDDDALCRSVASAAARALELEPSDVIVLLSRATAGGGGAVATLTGALRADDAEARLRTAVAETVAEGLGLPVDLVAVIRQVT